MDLTWNRELNPTWDEPKQRIIGRARAGIFDASYAELPIGASVPGAWWRVEADGRVIGYGWMDVVWGDAEILLAVAGDRRRGGTGTWVLDRLAEEAASRGLNYIYNSVRPSHPDAEAMTAWLVARGFAPREDGSLRRLSTPPADS